MDRSFLRDSGRNPHTLFQDLLRLFLWISGGHEDRNRPGGNCLRKGMQIGFFLKIGLDTDRSWTDLEKGGLLMVRRILRFTIQRGENWNMEIAVVDMKKIRVLVEHLDLDEKQEIRT